MNDTEFDQALIAAAFRLAADSGWRRVSPAAAARLADLPLERTRERFPSRSAILLRFGRLADQAALAEASVDAPVHDRLFGLLMRRMDVLQAHRGGVLALLQALPMEPPTALLLALATRRSMRWMLQAAGVSASGVRGELRVKGLLAVWLWGVRAWRTDESEDLSATMAALDSALHRAAQAAEWFGRGQPAAAADTAPASDTGPIEEPQAPAPL